MTKPIQPNRPSYEGPERRHEWHNEDTVHLAYAIDSLAKEAAHLGVKIGAFETTMNAIDKKLAVGEERLSNLDEDYKSLRNSLWGVVIALIGVTMAFAFERLN